MAHMVNLHQLPNLSALRSFEAAARHQNFSRAADELHVTHGAISHQVRALEDELGVQLFARHGKRIKITKEGDRFAGLLRKSLSDIATATESIKTDAKQQRLTVTSMSSFAARWLSPRLGQFIEQHPDLEVTLQSSNHMTDFEREAVDVGIRFGRGNYPGLVVEKVIDDFYYPVASSRFNNGKLPCTPEKIGRSTLLRCIGDPWTPWFQAAGVDFPEPTSGLVFQDSSMLVRAAVEGYGIALARHVIVCNDLDTGDLVCISDVMVQSPESYYLVCTPSALQKPQVKDFRTWLFGEIAKLRAPGVVRNRRTLSAQPLS